MAKQSGLTDIEIASAANMLPIQDVAGKLGIESKHLYQFGHHKAKVTREFTDQVGNRPDGKLVLVTAISPTPAGEGKTTTTIGLGDAAACLAPFLGSCAETGMVHCPSPTSYHCTIPFCLLHMCCFGGQLPYIYISSPPPDAGALQSWGLLPFPLPPAARG